MCVCYHVCCVMFFLHLLSFLLCVHVTAFTYSSLIKFVYWIIMILSSWHLQCISSKFNIQLVLCIELICFIWVHRYWACSFCLLIVLLFDCFLFYCCLQCYNTVSCMPEGQPASLQNCHFSSLHRCSRRVSRDHHCEAVAIKWLCVLMLTTYFEPFLQRAF